MVILHHHSSDLGAFPLHLLSVCTCVSYKAGKSEQTVAVKEAIDYQIPHVWTSCAWLYVLSDLAHCEVPKHCLCGTSTTLHYFFVVPYLCPGFDLCSPCFRVIGSHGYTLFKKSYWIVD
ncbi:hypothetical protein CHARACLAT_019695 [Characodon lateralis]|uniref:Uncharacterized protein n=1 Tax=Characodon lateralis TaxID=208331 RepID=A0ABU7DSX3_9TELE|nr:hypothetical protein [Characodon lateralis]